MAWAALGMPATAASSGSAFFEFDAIGQHPHNETSFQCTCLARHCTIDFTTPVLILFSPPPQQPQPIPFRGSTKPPNTRQPSKIRDVNSA
jgi:hypothetical protein